MSYPGHGSPPPNYGYPDYRPAGMQPARPNPTKVTWLRSLGIAFIVNGVLVLLISLLYIPGALINFVEAQSAGNEEEMVVVLAILGPLVLCGLVMGPLQILAGVKARRYEGRTLLWIAALSCPLTTLLCQCTPLSIILMVFALIALTDQSVKTAFNARAGGESVAAINQRFQVY